MTQTIERSKCGALDTVDWTKSLRDARNAAFAAFSYEMSTGKEWMDAAAITAVVFIVQMGNRFLKENHAEVRKVK